MHVQVFPTMFGDFEWKKKLGIGLSTTIVLFDNDLASHCNQRVYASC